MIEKLVWDSDFFNLNIGKCDLINKVAPSDFYNKAREDNYDLIYLINHDKVLSGLEIKLYDVYLMECMIIASIPSPNSVISPIMSPTYANNFTTIESLTPTELIECYNIAEQISSVSRFNNDKLIGINKTKELYRKWLDTFNMPNHNLFIEKKDDKIIGMLLIKTDVENKTGEITLIGVDNNLKRGGIGNKLMNQAFAFWATKNVTTIKTTYSLQNKPSVNFHNKLGFTKIEDIKFIYHYYK